MKARSLVLAPAVALALVSLALAGGAGSCEKPLKRTKEAVVGYARQNSACVRVVVGIATKDKKVSFSRELAPGDYSFFCVGEMDGLNGMELGVSDKDGKRVAKKEGADQTLLGFSVDEKTKGNFKLEMNPTALGEGRTAAHYALALVVKVDKEPYWTEQVFDKALERVKAIEGAGYVVEHAEFDMLSKPWSVGRTLEKASYWFDVVSDEDRVKKIDLDIKDGSTAVGKKEGEAGPVATAKADVTNGTEHKVEVAPTFQEGFKEAFCGLIIAKKK